MRVVLTVSVVCCVTKWSVRSSVHFLHYLKEMRVSYEDYRIPVSVEEDEGRLLESHHVVSRDHAHRSMDDPPVRGRVDVDTVSAYIIIFLSVRIDTKALHEQIGHLGGDGA